MVKLIKHIIDNKRIYKRVMYALILVGLFAFFILNDVFFQYKGLSCGTKSNVEVKK